MQAELLYIILTVPQQQETPLMRRKSDTGIYEPDLYTLSITGTERQVLINALTRMLSSTKSAPQFLAMNSLLAKIDPTIKEGDNQGVYVPTDAELEDQ